jgi:hypothetical protein
VYSQDPFSVALKQLSTVKIFAFGGIGYAGTTSQGEADFKVIMSQPPAIALKTFELLYATGNTQAKGYALAGILKLDRRRFNELHAALHSSGEKLATEKGCLISEQLVREVADDLESGKYDLWLR